MPVIDENGRVFGKLNLIDAAVAGALLFVLVPLAYGAYLLFRTPPPLVHPIEPVTFAAGTADRLVVITGEHLRPYLRVLVGETPATYLFETPERAVIRIPVVKDGTYDLAFFDESVEVVRQKKAITFAVARPRPAVTEVWLTGAFIGLSKDRADAIEANSSSVAIHDWGATVTKLGAAEPDVTRFRAAVLPSSVILGQYRVPAILRVRAGYVNGALQLLDDQGQVLGSDPKWVLPDEVRGALAITIEPGSVLSIPGALGHFLSKHASREDVSFYVERVQSEAPRPPSAITTVRLVGAFTGLTPARAHSLATNRAAALQMTKGWGAEILGLDAPEPDVAVLRTAEKIAPSVIVGRNRVPAVLRLRVFVVDGTLRVMDDQGELPGSDSAFALSDHARLGSATIVAPGAVLSMSTNPGEPANGWSKSPSDSVTFFVEQVYPEGTEEINVTARVITRPPIVELLRRSLNEPQPPPAFAALRPRLVSFELEREVLGTTVEDLRQGVTSILLASFRLPAVRTPSGWIYGGQASWSSETGINVSTGVQVKPGIEFYLEMATYRILLQVLTVEGP